MGQVSVTCWFFGSFVEAFMRHLSVFWSLLTCLFLVGGARAQEASILFPREGQDVRGEITVRLEGIPTGGYAQVKLDNQFVTATAQATLQLDTISDRTLFPNGDGTYKLEVTMINAGGKRSGGATVTFKVANNRVAGEGEAEAVKLVLWNVRDRLSDNVLRYRIFAESKGPVDEGAGGGAGGGGGDAGGGDGGITYLMAPMDWQVSALLRRIVRDTNMVDSSANVRTIVQEAYERPRVAPTDSEAAARPKKRRRGGNITMLAPWDKVWTKAAETGQYFVKMIAQNGAETNATRKAATIALADLLPTFPDVAVRPGSTWETTMSILGELSSRTPINVRAPITFTAFEVLQTPAGESRRCAKLESRFRLPENLAKKIAIGLENQAGRTAGGGTGAGGAANVPVSAGGGGAAQGALIEEDIDVARSDVARVLWFDIERSRVLRSEDAIRTYYETMVEAEGGAAPAPGAGAAEGEPKKVNYSLNVTTWLDDRIPAPTERFNAGANTAHSRDNVTEHSLTRAVQGPK